MNEIFIIYGQIFARKHAALSQGCLSRCVRLPGLLLLAFVAPIAPLDLFAQSYPASPIRLVVGFSAGGGIDVPARVVAQKLSESLGQPVLVENAPGAAGFIAMQKVATSPANGYTLLITSSNDAVLPALRPNLSIDLQRDFAPVSLVGVGAMVLVIRASMPERNVKELIATAQSRELKFGSSGVGGTVHLTGALFSQMTNAKLLHVAYKGSADTVVAIAADQIDLSFPSITAAMPLANAGKLRALAVTSAKRASALPSIPTLDESGLRGFDRTFWFGVTAPAGVSKDIIARLAAEIGRLVNTSDMKELLGKQGLEPQTNTPEQFAAFTRKEIEQSAKLLELANVKAE